MTHSLSWRAVALACATVTVSCGDTVAPRVHPVSGTYLFTTTLDSLSHEADGPLACGAGSIGYCTLWAASTTGALSGTFVVDDAVETMLDWGGPVYNSVSGHADGLFGSQPVSVTIASGAVTGPVTMADTARQVGVQLAGTGQERIRLSGTMAGDSIVGTVAWSQVFARSPSTYKGTFVARRIR